MNQGMYPKELTMILPEGIIIKILNAGYEITSLQVSSLSGRSHGPPIQQRMLVLLLVAHHKQALLLKTSQERTQKNHPGANLETSSPLASFHGLSAVQASGRGKSYLWQFYATVVDTTCYKSALPGKMGPLAHNGISTMDVF